ncbi:MAG: hypothetical protein HUU23_05935 [Caldilineales bacterium]|nr:hypothetical protein [Caldilineales bacterium]
MSDNRYRFLLIGAVIGGVLGMAAAWLAADALDEQAQLQELDVAAIRIQPRARDWLTFTVAAVALLRQFSEMLAPKKKK